MESLHAIRDRSESGPDLRRSRKVAANIYWTILRSSKRLRTGNFRSIEASDIEALFELYDEQFYDGWIRRCLRELGHPLSFRLSGKMTRAGGKTTREERWQGKRLIGRTYEIAISTVLLFQTFQNESQPVIVTGLSCSDRLQALQRIMEHELIHLVEMMVWYHSDCFRKRFQRIAGGLFGHSESTHQLTTVDDRAFRDFGIRVGAPVRFRHEGRLLSGFVNRITRRATVLVETPQGQLFNDGKRYAKFYVPIADLQPVGRRTAS